MHERQRAAVDDRNFRAVDVDVEIGDAEGHDRGQEMLHGAHGHIVLAHRGGVIERGGRCLQRRNAESIEVRADEGDAVARGNGMKRDSGVDAGVEADAGDADVGADGLALDVHSRSLPEHGKCHAVLRPAVSV